MKDGFLHENERLDDLQIEGLKIIQSKQFYSFTSDSVLLANLVKVRHSDVVCDLGSGSGIISVLLAGKKKARQVFGVEIQTQLFEMSERTRVLNGLDNLKFFNQPLQEIHKTLGFEVCDIVVANPPYFSAETTQCEQASRATGRSECEATLAQFVECGTKLLKYSGSFYLIIKALRLAEMVKLLEKANLEVKDMTMIFPKQGKDCDTVVVRATKGGSVGMKIHSLVVYNDDNTMTAEAKQLYSKDKT